MGPRNLPPPAADILRAASSKRTAKLTTLSAGKRGGIHHEGSPWANALKPYCVHPETFPKEEVVEYDDEFVVIYDKYPKAKQHLLVMPRKEMNGLASLGRDSLPVFEKLVSRGDAVADRWMDGWGFVLAVDGYLPMADGGWPVLVRAFWSRLKREHPELEFRKGFHAVPSMRQLHMHVISQDFVSPALKNRKHWNSFTSLFFKDASTVIEILRAKGAVKFNEEEHEELLKLPLQCHKCAEKPLNIPKLKAHLLTHLPKDQ